MAKLSEADTKLFIEEVESFEPLWKKDVPEYRMKNTEKANIWKDIGLKFNMTGPQAKAKFRNLIATYRQNLKQSKGRSGAGADEVMVTWLHMSAMKFIDRFIQSNPERRTSQDDESSQNGGEADRERDDFETEEPEILVDTEDTDLGDTSQDSDAIEASGPAKKRKGRAIGTRGGAKTNHLDQVMNMMQAQSSALMQKLPSANIIWGKSLGAQIDDISTTNIEQAELAKIKCQVIIAQAKLGRLSMPQTYQPYNAPPYTAGGPSPSLYVPPGELTYQSL